MGRIQFCHPLLHARDWQHRPQLDDVCRWWSDGGAGVCALIGIGGAGKTAIADRFLRVLPGAMPPRADLPQRADLPSPTQLFVFSFYDAPNPDSFFAALYDFLVPPAAVDGSAVENTSSAEENVPLSPGGSGARGEGDARRPSYYQTLLTLQSAGPCLLVLDGLEKVQDDGVRGGIFGDLQDGRLSDILVRIAEGYLPHVSVLITSRFPLAILDEQRSYYYRSIDVEEIDVAAAVRLLKQRGVRGTDNELAGIARDCGLHALTVDLTGGYIAEFGDGDPATPLQLTRFEDEAEARRAEPTNARRRAVRLQEYRFSRIAERYRDAFKQHDPAALALLERLCLFRLGVDADMLATIFTGGEGKSRISGPALASLTRVQLDQTLDHLVAMKLIEATIRARAPGSPQSSTAYSIHPAVRDGFLSSLDPDTRRCGHEAVRSGLNAKLGDAPGSNPSDPATLDVLEEIVYHTVEAGQLQAAWQIYQSRLGGCHNLIAELNEFIRARRLTRLLLRDCESSAAAIDPSIYVVLCSDCGYSSLEVGDLDQAKLVLSKGLRAAKPRRIHVQTLSGNLAQAQFLSGQLTLALNTLREAIPYAPNLKCVLELLGYIAYVDAMRGVVGPERGIHEVQDLVGSDIPEHIRAATPPPTRTALLGRSSEIAELKADLAKLEASHPGGHRSVAEAILTHTQFVLEHCENELSRNDLARVRTWALGRDAKEILCWCAVVQARIELAIASHQEDSGNSRSSSALQSCHAALTDGLKIARDCGFGLYHIDLLLARARWHLLQGNPNSALDDLRVALDNGIPANSDTGQPELLAATHAECGYAWSIAEGLSLRGEALLLKAAQSLGQDSFVPAKRHELPPHIRDLITQAETCLTQALDRWQPLRDPEPNNANFVHPQTRTEYNYRAADTYRVLESAGRGLLTRYPLENTLSKNTSVSKGAASTMPPQPPPRVLISYSHDSDAHDRRVVDLADRLRRDGIDCRIDQYITNPSQGWPLWMDEQVEEADFVLVLFTERYTQKSREPRKSGVRFESVLMLQDLYEAGMINDKFIPILFDRADSQHIVKWLKPYNYYTVDTDAGHEALRRRLLDDPSVVMPPLGTPTRKGPQNP